MKDKIANEHKPRSFSVELKSKRNLKTITVSNGSNERALRKQLIKLVYKRIIEISRISRHRLAGLYVEE